MAKNKRTQSVIRSDDSAYFLKMVLYLIMGSLWFKFVNTDLTVQVPVPIGFIVGLLFASHEHFQIDRKIEYAVLLVSMFIAFWLPIGIYVIL